MKRIWDDEMGWGTVIEEYYDFYIVAFDADPWHNHYILNKEN